MQDLLLAYYIGKVEKSKLVFKITFPRVFIKISFS
jgi:hypothetical protein